ncbi:hypothetical protein R1flu_001870 [Riccia fluitans]|uniref:Uncharacterized protein n=1 Tax=Riccia fluitans TaxID=41844 RepID=A0ABD1Y502_9MARC
MLNAIFAPIRPEHFQHNLLAFYHHAWVAITNPTAPTLDWGDVVEKTISKQIKALGVYHLCSNTKTKTEDEKEPAKDVPRTFCEGKANGSKPLDHKIDYDEWGFRLESLGHETSKLFEAFHVEVGNVTAEAVARNMKEMFAPPPVVEADIQQWKKMVKNLAKLLTEEQKRNKEIFEQRDYYKGKIQPSEKIPKIAMWCA